VFQQGMPVIASACESQAKDKTPCNAEKCRACAARLRGIVTEGHRGAEDIMDDFVTIPAVHPLAATIPASSPCSFSPTSPPACAGARSISRETWQNASP
jgi:glucosamine 6-phosphate synthetase-like amidotransferase/phosphosugar isomerase protein